MTVLQNTTAVAVSGSGMHCRAVVTPHGKRVGIPRGTTPEHICRSEMRTEYCLHFSAQDARSTTGKSASCKPGKPVRTQVNQGQHPSRRGKQQAWGGAGCSTG